MSCKDDCNDCPDSLRLLTVSADASNEAAEVEESVSAICEGGRIYSHTLSAVWNDDDGGLPPVDAIGAILRSGGTEIRLPSYGCKVSSVRFDLPGLCLSPSTRLIAQPGFLAYWHVNYGNCK